MNFINLGKKDFLAEGSERNCYLHPEDNTKLIKTIKKNKKNFNDQNKIDEIYYQVLEKKKISFDNIPRCYGYVNTNLGKGLVFQRVLNYDNTPCKGFRYMIKHKLISEKEQKELIFKLKTFLFDNDILFIDVSLTNVLYQKKSEDESALIIIDGLGAKKIGFKFSLYRNISMYKKYKINKQWSKFISLYNKDLKRARRK